MGYMLVGGALVFFGVMLGAALVMAAKGKDANE